MSVVSMKQLLEVGAHFGHLTRRWNPKMAEFIYMERNGVYIIDLQKTVKKIDEAYAFIKQTVDAGEDLIFVGTKKQAQDSIKEEAERCGQFYVNNRWLGGIREMKKLPGLMFVVDPKKEHIAVLEARKLGIPIVAIVDTNCDPDEVDYVIPGNDDAIRAVKFISSIIADAVIEARQGEANFAQADEGDDDVTAESDEEIEAAAMKGTEDITFEEAPAGEKAADA